MTRCFYASFLEVPPTSGLVVAGLLVYYYLLHLLHLLQLLRLLQLLQ